MNEELEDDTDHSGSISSLLETGNAEAKELKLGAKKQPT